MIMLQSIRVIVWTRKSRWTDTLTLNSQCGDYSETPIDVLY